MSRCRGVHETGLVDTAESLHLSRYDILMVASLVGQVDDWQGFPKSGEVTYDRLHVHHSVKFDSKR